MALATLIKGYPIALALLLAAHYPRRFGVRYVVVTGAVEDRVLAAATDYPRETRFYESLRKEKRECPPERTLVSSDGTADAREKAAPRKDFVWNPRICCPNLRRRSFQPRRCLCL